MGLAVPVAVAAIVIWSRDCVARERVSRVVVGDGFGVGRVIVGARRGRVVGVASRWRGDARCRRVAVTRARLCGRRRATILGRRAIAWTTTRVGAAVAVGETVGTRVAVGGSAVGSAVAVAVAVAVGSAVAVAVAVVVGSRTVAEGLSVGVATTAWAAVVRPRRGGAGEAGPTKPSPATTVAAIADRFGRWASRTVTIRAAVVNL